MSTLSPAPHQPALAAAPAPEPGQDAVREYAYHLYQQGGGAPGHDLDDWLEATACLKANIPADSSHRRLHLQVNGPEKTGQLVSSPAMAKREVATLSRQRESLEDAPMVADLNMRTSLFDDRV